MIKSDLIITILRKLNFAVTTHACIHIPVVHTTPTSLLWLQLWAPHPRCWHWCSDDSLSVHLTLSSQIGPDPRPKYLKLSAPLNPSCLHATLVWGILHVRLHIVPHWPLWYICKIPWTNDRENVSRCNLNGAVPRYKEILMTCKTWSISADLNQMIVIMTFDDILLLYSRRSYTCIAHNTNILIVITVMNTPSLVLALI